MSEALDALVCPDPVFILTGSRSGSTLLRFILDTHPDFACPPETMITAACVALLRSWDILENAGSGQHRHVTESAKLPAVALETIRDAVDQLYGRYLARRGKPRWCDKSLDSHFNAELLAAIYPQASFVCLYRHCMDVIASGIEVCPWGVSRFGFDGYVAGNPGNNVAAIGSYWADTTRHILAFEESHPERCFRLRYEDLVTAPEEEAAKLLKFLGAEPFPGITQACFTTPHEGDGPGDEKIWFTSDVTSDTIGRGVKVPAAAIPESTRQQINETLNKLGYRAVNDDWNQASGPVDPRLPDDTAAVGEQPDSAAMTPCPQGASAQAQQVLQALEQRIRSSMDAEPAFLGSRWPALTGQTVAFVAAHAGADASLTWTFSGDSGPVDGQAVMTMIASPQIWRTLLDGEANLIVEIRNGRLRCINRRDMHRVRSDEVHAIAWLLGLAQVPLARAAES
jgi:hypothetical protein